MNDEDVKKRIKNEQDRADEIKSLEDDGLDLQKQESRFVADCLMANEKGDGELYVYLYRDKYVYNATTGEMYKWGGHSWTLDTKRDYLASVDGVARRYLEETSRIWDEIKLVSGINDTHKQKLEKRLEALYKRVNALRTTRRRKSCIEFAITLEERSLAIDGRVFDSNTLLVGCKNGVLDLRTGEFRPGRQDDYITKATPTEFKGLDEPAPLWEQSLSEMLDGDEEVIDYVGRLSGYGLSGLNTERVFPVFIGRAQNGKGTIAEVIGHVLGPLVAPIRSEMLLSQPFGKNSSGSSPDIMALKGLRIAIASEVDENTSFSAAQVKLLTGGDALSARNLYDKYQTHFRPTHLLILLANDKPRAPGGDAAFWHRMHLVEFPFSFVKDPKEPYEKKANSKLAEQLKAEAPGILAWMARYFLRYQEIGLSPPEKVRRATNEYRRDEDLLGSFIEDRCVVDPSLSESSSALYTEFSDWWREHVGKNPRSQKWFGKHMKEKFARSRPGGTYKYSGIGLKIPK
jgi:putative DNA primase/helicase